MKDYKTCFQIFDHTTGELVYSKNRVFHSEGELFLCFDEVVSSFKRGVWKRENLTLSIQLDKVDVPVQKDFF